MELFAQQWPQCPLAGPKEIRDLASFNGTHTLTYTQTVVVFVWLCQWAQSRSLTPSLHVERERKRRRRITFKTWRKIDARHAYFCVKSALCFSFFYFQLTGRERFKKEKSLLISPPPLSQILCHLIVTHSCRHSFSPVSRVPRCSRLINWDVCV